jgi:hypothetical protein
MKTRIVFSFLLSVAIALAAGVGISMAVPTVNPMTAAGFVFIFRTAYQVFYSQELNFRGLFAGVNKEIWIDKLKENFYAKGDWINGAEDWSQWVEYNTINFTIAGSNPVILKNNSTWPIVAAQRTDTNQTVVLDTYDSTTTRVYNVEAVEAAADKLNSVIRQHRDALMQEIKKEALWNYAPATAAAGSFSATGSNRPAVIGSQTTVAARLALKDLLRVKQEFDNRNFPEAGRNVILNPYHVEDLALEDISLFKTFANLKSGEPISMFGLNVYSGVSNTPVFHKSTGAKQAYGAAPDNTNDCIASVAYINSEVMRAEGSMEMFYKEKGINPEQRADEVGFQVRFKAVPQRSVNFLNIAIYSGRA